MQNEKEIFLGNYHFIYSVEELFDDRYGNRVYTFDIIFKFWETGSFSKRKYFNFFKKQRYRNNDFKVN